VVNLGISRVVASRISNPHPTRAGDHLCTDSWLLPSRVRI